MSAKRYAIIGSGNMGQEHMRNLALIPDVAVTAIADPDAGMRETAAALAGPDVRAFEDPRDLLAADVADALVIATPNPHPCGLPAAGAGDRPADHGREAALHHGRGLPHGGRGRERPVRAGLGRHGIPLHAAGGPADRGGAGRHHRHPAHAGDPRASLPVPDQSRRLEPLRAQHRRHHGGEMLPFLRPDAADRRCRTGAGLWPAAPRT